MKFQPIELLDHGYIRLIETWGTGDAGVPEAGIIEAARQSTQGSFRGWKEDRKLLRTLYNSKPQHATPFEFAGCIFEIQAPILVFREWMRHRTQGYNEMSGRYAAIPDMNYVPTVERLMMSREKTKNKQAGVIDGAEEMTLETATWYRECLIKEYADQEKFYQEALSRGVAKELARSHVGVGRYSRMRATTNLRNWLGFMTLRADPAAQWEIQQYAQAAGTILAEQFPQTWELFDAKRKEA